MALGLLSRKIGMTQVFVGDRAVGATVIEAQPSMVTRIKTEERDGYDALQLGYRAVEPEALTRPLGGEYAAAGLQPHRYLFEVRVDDPTNYKVGDKVGVDIFSEGEKIDVMGASRGLGFQGVMKRWNFSGGPKTHGSRFNRRPGSVGNCVEPGRVIKGKKLPGQTGGGRVTIKGLKVLRVDPEKNILLVKGATPGSRGNILKLGKSDG
jgi:large subunit ribosomal protein L3